MNHQEAIAALTQATNWRKSSHSGGENGGCVEVNTTDLSGWVGLRDTKLGAASPVLAYTRREWDLFRRSMNEGEFDL